MRRLQRIWYDVSKLQGQWLLCTPVALIGSGKQSKRGERYSRIHYDNSWKFTETKMMSAHISTRKQNGSEVRAHGIEEGITHRLWFAAVVINTWNERYDSYMVISKHLDTRKYLVSHRRMWSWELLTLRWASTLWNFHTSLWKIQTWKHHSK